MTRDDIAACKERISEALGIMESVADEQAEVCVLIALREVMDDLIQIELWQRHQGKVIHLGMPASRSGQARPAIPPHGWGPESSPLLPD